jgi:hypothetical protein
MLLTFLPGLALNCNPPDFCLLLGNLPVSFRKDFSQTGRETHPNTPQKIFGEMRRENMG